MSTQSNQIWTNIIFAASMACGLAAFTARADDAKPTDAPKEKPAATADNVNGLVDNFKARMEGLNLTDDQKAKVAEILKGSKEELAAAKGDAPKMRQLMQGLREKVGAILTDEQKAKMQTARQGAATGNVRIGAFVDNLQANIDKLELSSDQKEKVNPVVAEIRKSFDELRGQFKDGSDREKLREKFTAFTTESTDKLKAVLTPEQAEKLKGLMEQGRKDRPAARKEGATDKPEGTKPEAK